MLRTLSTAVHHALSFPVQAERALSCCAARNPEHLKLWCGQLVESALGPGRRFSAQLAQAEQELTIDPSVANRLKQIQAETPGSTVGLRIEVEGGGCSGFSYKFHLESDVQPDDKVFELDGTRVVCDTLSYEYLRGSRIEFEENLMRSAFVVHGNPNAEATCGCGSSFAAKMK